MKTAILFFMFSNCLWQESLSKLGTLRELYFCAVEDKKSARDLSQLLKGVDTTAAPVMVCYKGAAEMISAKYAMNPLVKLTAFKKGKQLIEQAVRRDTTNIEMRFIRFSIQSNLPGFLNYSDAMPSDKKLMLNNINKMDDKNLKNIITGYLANPKYCTEEEIKKLRE